MPNQINLEIGSRGIEWCDETRNPIGGCLHDCKWQMPDGTVAGCYAKKLAEQGEAASAYPHGFAYHYWRPNAVKQLTQGKEPLLIFVDSMSDMFAANVPEEQVGVILDAIAKAPHHTYQCLTKAAPQLLKYVDQMPPNLWVGVSSPPDFFMGKRLSHHQQQAMLRRSLEVLAEVKHRTKNIVWMSAEPVSWDLTSVIDTSHPLDWIVIGAASNGPRYFQPDHNHVRNLLAVMDETKTPVFFKGNLRQLFKDHDLGRPELNRWREDFPMTYWDHRPIPAVARRQQLCRVYGWTQSRDVRGVGVAQS
jgi:protein gp37